MASNPIPQGKYKPAVRYGNFIYTAGMTPRKDGVLIMAEKVSAAKPAEYYYDAAVQAATNALTAAKNALAEGEKIAQWLANGAQPTETVKSILTKNGLLK